MSVFVCFLRLDSLTMVTNVGIQISILLKSCNCRRCFAAISCAIATSQSLLYVERYTNASYAEYLILVSADIPTDITIRNRALAV